MQRLVLIAVASVAAATATAGAAQAQVYGPGPRPAYAAADWNDGDEGCGSRLTLLGAHAGVTVLGVDVGASAGLHVGLHDRCGGGRHHHAHYAPTPGEYGPSEQAYGPESYGPLPAYSQQYGGAGGYGYASQPTYSYGWPCGC